MQDAQHSVEIPKMASELFAQLVKDNIEAQPSNSLLADVDVWGNIKFWRHRAVEAILRTMGPRSMRILQCQLSLADGSVKQMSLEEGLRLHHGDLSLVVQCSCLQSNPHLPISYVMVSRSNIRHEICEKCSEAIYASHPDGWGVVEYQRNYGIFAPLHRHTELLTRTHRQKPSRMLERPHPPRLSNTHRASTDTSSSEHSLDDK